MIGLPLQKLMRYFVIKWLWSRMTEYPLWSCKLQYAEQALLEEKCQSEYHAYLKKTFLKNFLCFLLCSVVDFDPHLLVL